MVLGQPAPVVVEGVEGCRREHAALSHAAAEHLSPSTGAVDVVSRTGQGRARRCPQSLREADVHGVEGSRQVGFLGAGRNCGIPEPRTIEVQSELVVARLCSNGSQVRQGEHAAPRAVVGVLDADERRSRVHVAARTDEGAHVRRLEQATSAGFCELDATPGGTGPRFEMRQVRAFADDHLVAALGMKEKSDLISHRSRGDEQRRFFSQQRGHAFLERPGRGILAEHVVADLRGRHRRPHAGRRLGDRVGSQIEKGRPHGYTRVAIMVRTSCLVRRPISSVKAFFRRDGPAAGGAWRRRRAREDAPQPSFRHQRRAVRRRERRWRWNV